ncbi:MAG: mechanosensitive ion channel [Pseudomonadota bacterium]|nr:mechanosensitive ion channel [Pseudomonadota bacterium]
MNGCSAPTPRLKRFNHDNRHLVLGLFSIAMLLMIGAFGGTFAQAAPAEAVSQIANPAAKNSAPGRESDIQALDQVLNLLKDDKARAHLISDLEKLRSSMAAHTSTAKNPSGKGRKEDAGLVTAVTKAVKTVGEKAPEALAAPLDKKVDEAAEDVQIQLGAGLEQGYIQRFLLTAAPGWFLALVIAFALHVMPWVRRSRERLTERVRLSVDTAEVLRAILAGALWRLIPLLCGAVVIGIWPILIDMSDTWTRAFLTFGIPALAAGAIWQLTSGLLALLGPSRGWRRIGYAQRRLVPWISGLSAIAVASAILRSPFIWDTLSANVADLTALALDLAAGCLTIVFIVKYRLVVRSLMIRSRKASAEPKDISPLWRVARMLAKRWHVLGILFVLAHMVARLLGGTGDFITSTLLSLLVIIVGLVIALSIDTRLANRAKRRRRYRTDVISRIGTRYLQIARVYVQGVIILLVGFVCLHIWGLDFSAVLKSQPGWAIVRPVLSIIAALTVGWMLWVALDSFIANTLSSVDHHGRARAQSSRTKTLLPLMRNVIFITLCAIILVSVLANLGINVAPLLAGAGIIGLAIGFGSQQLVQDLITGLFILFEGTIAVGDVIDTGDRAGVVEALTIRTVRIRDGDGALHTIPFSEIKALKNRSRDYGVYTVKVAVGYESNLDQAMEIMREVGQELQADPNFIWDILAPLEIWGVDQFAPEGVVIMGAIKTRPLQQWRVGREFNLRLKKRFDKAGIAMAVPTLSLVTPPAQDMGDGKAPLIKSATSAKSTAPGRANPA